MKNHSEQLDDLQKLRQQITKKQKQLDSQEVALEDIKKKVAKAKASLNSIMRESGTRKRYLLEQENIITHMMKEANDSISDAHIQYSQLERSIGLMEGEKIQLRRDIDNLLLDKNALEADISRLEAVDYIRIG